MFPFHGKPRGVVIAAPRSGSGKTTVTLGLLRALQRRGISVRPLKCGPDYIDPAFHEAACGRASFNLDSWAMRRETVLGLLGEATDGDFIVAEASMGLFDGVAAIGNWGNGASGDIAALAGLPVVLVIDVSGQSQTAAAVARGFQGFQPGVEIAGVILNRVASARHESLTKAGFERTGMKVFGAIPRKDSIGLPERHLGLVQAGETQELSSRLDALADLVEAHIEVDALLATPSGLALDRAPASAIRVKPPGQRIALASDAAFSFVYPHLLKAWRASGAEIMAFSPLADEAPCSSADVVWLPGGYPELHAGRLAVNQTFRSGMMAFAKSKPVHGECGGYMMLGESLIDANGECYPMLGLLPLETSFAARKLHLGYRRAELVCDCPPGRKGEVLFGHEFHYSTILKEAGEPLFSASDAAGSPVASRGLRNGTVTGSFLHMIDT